MTARLHFRPSKQRLAPDGERERVLKSASEGLLTATFVNGSRQDGVPNGPEPFPMVGGQTPEHRVGAVHVAGSVTHPQAADEA